MCAGGSATRSRPAGWSRAGRPLWLLAPAPQLSRRSGLEWADGQIIPSGTVGRACDSSPDALHHPSRSPPRGRPALRCGAQVDGQRAQIHVAKGRTVAAYSRPGRSLLTYPGLAGLRDARWPVTQAVLDGKLASTGMEGILRERPRAGSAFRLPRRAAQPDETALPVSVCDCRGPILLSSKFDVERPTLLLHLRQRVLNSPTPLKADAIGFHLRDSPHDKLEITRPDRGHVPSEATMSSPEVAHTDDSPGRVGDGDRGSGLNVSVSSLTRTR